MTKAFTEKFETDIHRTLNLTEKEYVKVDNLKIGSVFVDFIILLRNDSQENKTTIYQKLLNEIKFNQTGYLEKYFPFADQVVVVVGKNYKNLILLIIWNKLAWCKYQFFYMIPSSKKKKQTKNI